MLCLYNESGERSKMDNAQAWVDERKKCPKNPQTADLLFEKSENLRKQIEDEKQKKLARERAPASGSATKANRKRSWQQGDDDAKKAKNTGRPKKDNTTMYIGRRVAKAFEQENDEGKIVTEIFFGTIDRLAKDTGTLLWHIQVGLVLCRRSFISLKMLILPRNFISVI